MTEWLHPRGMDVDSSTSFSLHQHFVQAEASSPKDLEVQILRVKLTSEHPPSAHGTIPPLHHTSPWCAAQLSTRTALVVCNKFFEP
jgi:hypothetical protein